VTSKVGIDSWAARSKPIDEFLGQPFDRVITVFTPTAEACPVFPGRAIRIHWPLDDPAAIQRDDRTRLQPFRRVRNQVRELVRSFLKGFT